MRAARRIADTVTPASDESTLRLGANVLAALPALLLMASCSISRVEVVRHHEIETQNPQSVVILSTASAPATQPEAGFLECLGSAVDDEQLTVYGQQHFRDTLFPWFEPRTAPTTLAELSALLARAPVAAKLRSTGVRYLVWVGGDTQTTDGGGGISCGLAPSGGGCIGFAWWDRDSTYEAVVWDLQRQWSVGAVSAEVSGTSYLPAVIIPIPLIARTRAVACRSLGEQLGELLRGKERQFSPREPQAPR